ncbi:HER158Cp [Eremothecium sinecaudum]|uniref:Spindle pole component BBP1 n=1 Tax=Eremothecium sinecaudum TaxID=45286 RepID=A0A109UZJ8_9SACH|nr:HER158Cp [Eremothecium sinecaudum]AMD21437.1 HER158Cp [Eremothecium sinecaudum]
MGFLGDGSEDSTGALKWIFDALLKRRESPSLKYNREFSQDDTNNRTRGLNPPLWENQDLRRPRSHRSNSMDTEFRARFELLPDEEEPDLVKPVLMEPVKLDSRSPMDDSITDTFKMDARRKNELNFRPPRPDDPIISRLFGQNESHANRADGPSRSAGLPGAFPHSSSGAPDENGSPLLSYRTTTIDRTNDYIKLLGQLSLNNKELSNLHLSLQKHRQQAYEEDTYRQKYLELRQELIQELRQSKMIYDNYTHLYERYKNLKKNSQNQPYYQNLIAKLEAQIVDLTISKEENDRKLRDELLQSQIQYESRINELEDLLKSRNSSILNTTPSTSKDSDLLGTPSPYRKYNDTIDTQFLNHIVK